MKRLPLLVPMIALVAAAASSIAAADVPSAQTSIVPAMLTVVGRSGSGAADPVGAFTVVVKKLSGNPVPGADVVLAFYNCPDMHVCTDQGDPNVVVQCQFGVLRAQADGTGTVTFRVIGCAGNSGNSPGATGPTLEVYADGVLLATVPVAFLDQNGCDGMSAADLSAWFADFFSGQPFSRSDYDGDRILTSGDMSLWLTSFFSGNSALGGVAAACP
jgi:hypothetical protein